VIRETKKSCVAPKEPHENAENGTCIFELGVDETLCKMDPYITEIHQEADNDTTFNVVHYVGTIEETERQKMMQAHFNMVVSLFFDWSFQMSDGTRQMVAA